MNRFEESVGRLDVLLEQIRTNALPPPSPEMAAMYERALERMANDTRTDEQKIEDGVDFIMNGPDFMDEAAILRALGGDLIQSEEAAP